MLTTSQTTLEFRELKQEDRQWAAPLLERSGGNGCEYSFTTLFMWRKFYHNRIALQDGVLYICSGESYLPPVGGDMREGIERLWNHARGEGRPFVLYGADAALAAQIEQWYPGKLSIEPSPGDFDYLYNSGDLAELPGKKYHSKRNHIAAFSRAYAWTYEPLDDGNTEDVIELSREWCRQKGNCEDRGLKSERCAIREALGFRRELGIVGGLIRVDGKAIAFTFGSPINRETFDVHVEKALPDYGTAYTVINREFVSRELRDYRYINRENDLGLDGLRRAKQSYHPAILLEKYVCREK